MTTYTISDSNSSDSGFDYNDAVDRIAEWFYDAAAWRTGSATEAEHAAVRTAIDGVPTPADGGALADLKDYASDICDAVAEAMGGESFQGHGNYYVSAADSLGVSLTVTEDDQDDEE